MKNDFSEKVYKDIKNKFDNALEEFAGEISFQIESLYQSCIQLFYDDYNPNYYKRTYSTYEASDHWDDFFKFQKINDIYESGINISSDNIIGEPYRAEKDWVFERTFKKGIHGLDGKEKFMNKKSLDSLLLDFVYNKGIMSHGKQKNKKIKSWKYGELLIKQGVYRVGIPKPMKPTPKKIMDKTFKNLVKKKNMDNIFSQIFEKQFN